jgi:hypothetical protein
VALTTLESTREHRGNKLFGGRFATAACHTNKNHAAETPSIQGDKTAEGSISPDSTSHRTPDLAAPRPYFCMPPSVQHMVEEMGNSLPECEHPSAPIEGN